MHGQDSSSHVQIDGLKTITEQKARSWLTAQMELVEKNGVSMARADDLAFFLESALLDRGFDDAFVDWQLSEKSILLTVNEGRTQNTTGITVSGNNELTSGAIEELLLTNTRDRLRLKPDTTVPFVRNDISTGKALILDLYRLIGYINVNVEIAEQQNPLGTNLIVTITEGLKHIIGEISMPEALNAEMAKTFTDIQLTESGQALTPSCLTRLRAKIHEAAVNHGYYHCDIEITQQSNSVVSETNVKKVNLLVQANWGDLVIIDHIEIVGNKKVPNKFFNKQLSDIVGNPYSPQKTNRTIETLLRSGAFETIRSELIEMEDGSSSLKIYVEESKSRSLGLYGGFATYEGPLVGIEYQDRNLFGSARKIDATIEYSRRGLRGEVQYLDPWFLWSDYELRASLFAFNRQEEGYERLATGGRYGLTRRFGPQNNDSFSLIGEAVYTEIINSEIPTAQLGDTNYISHFIGIGLGVDRRDQTFNASQGWIANGSIGIASDLIGSEIDYAKASIGFAFYQPVGIGTFRFRAQAGIIQTLNSNSELPIGLRFFNGGRSSVRSFGERELGEIDPQTGFPLGGEFYSIFNTEYVIPIGSVDGLSMISFFDAGNLLPDADRIGFDNMRYGYGLGLEYGTLIGPIRIEYGINPNPQIGEADGTLHIGFGSEF